MQSLTSLGLDLGVRGGGICQQAPEVCGVYNWMAEVGNDGSQKMALYMVHLKHQ